MRLSLEVESKDVEIAKDLMRHVLRTDFSEEGAAAPAPAAQAPDSDSSDDDNDDGACAFSPFTMMEWNAQMMGYSMVITPTARALGVFLGIEWRLLRV